jgi:hypothetical protein
MQIESLKAWPSSHVFVVPNRKRAKAVITRLWIVAAKTSEDTARIAGGAVDQRRKRPDLIYVEGYALGGHN